MAGAEPVLLPLVKAAGRTPPRGPYPFPGLRKAARVLIPELSRYHRRPRGHEPDLRLLYQWMERAGLRPRLCESISLSRPDPKRPYAGPIQLSVRRHVHDCHDRLLELTDLSFPASWEHLVFEIASPSMSLPRARALIRP